VIEASAFTVLQDRYKISKESVIGEGGFAKVYRGLDTKECRGVAVKVYNSTDSAAYESYIKSIEVLSKLHKIDVKGMDNEPNSPQGTMQNTASYKPGLLKKNLATMKSIGDLSEDRLPEKVLREMSFQDCFVKLLGFSMDALGKPGLDIETETYFLVLELGDSSMDEVLAKCKHEKNTLSNEELRSLHWALVSIVCGLHSEGYVHLDIKPVNIVRFNSSGGQNGSKAQWKLIDLDGAMKTGSEVPLTDVVYTSQYMSPELAQALISARKAHDRGDHSKAHLKLSRLMDVWSVGLCALEAIFLTPVLDPWYNEWKEETGNETKYLEWLSDTATDPIISGSMQAALTEIDRDMCRLLKGMLAKDPKFRLCMPECVNHPWLKPIRMAIQDDIDTIVADAMTGSTTPMTGSTPLFTPKTTGGTGRSRGLTFSSENSRDCPASMVSEKSGNGAMGATSTEKARIVVSGVVTRTCVTM